MIKRVLIAVISLGAIVAQAKIFTSDTLTDPRYVDTEVVTNIVCSFSSSPVCLYTTELSFQASASNCVELAVGQDSDEDGRLSATEVGVAVGWDCGFWFVRGQDGAFSRVCGEDVLGGRTWMSWTVDIRSERAKKAVMQVEGDRIEWSRGEDPFVRELFDRNWNMIRISVRGVEGASERVEIEVRENGFVFVVK